MSCIDLTKAELVEIEIALDARRLPEDRAARAAHQTAHRKVAAAIGRPWAVKPSPAPKAAKQAEENSCGDCGCLVSPTDDKCPGCGAA